MGGEVGEVLSKKETWGHSPAPWLRKQWCGSYPHPQGKSLIQHWQDWILFLGSLEMQVAYWPSFLATSPVFRVPSVRVTLVSEFIWGRGLNCYKFRLNSNFSAEHWTPGKFPQERSFWTDLKIQRSCGLTTSQLKGSGSGFPQSDPHCALCRSTAAVIPTRRGYAEAVMTIHFLRRQLSCLWKRRNMYVGLL